MAEGERRITCLAVRLAVGLAWDERPSGGGNVASDTRQRMIEAAASSLRRRGLTATSFTDVLTASGAARGAIYHHFPGGKDELAQDAVAWTGRRVRDEFAALDTGDVDSVLRGFLDLIRPIVAQAAGGASCAVAAVAMETTPSQAGLTAAAAHALQSWVDVLAGRLRQAGLAFGDARALAQLMTAVLEGSLVVARATGDTTAFEDSARMLLLAGRAYGETREAGTHLD